MAAEHRQPRLLFGRDDIERDAGFAVGAFDEGGAVARAPARLGRDRAGKGDVAAPELVGADGERGDGALDRGIAQPAGRGEPLAQPDDARKGIDDGEPLGGGPRDQQAAVVGAQIERCIMAPLAGAGRPRRIMRRPRRAIAAPRRHPGGRLPHCRTTMIFSGPGRMPPPVLEGSDSECAGPRQPRVDKGAAARLWRDPLVPRRLKVRPRTLTPLIEVRILTGHPAAGRGVGAARARCRGASRR